jgi:protease-4
LVNYLRSFSEKHSCPIYTFAEDIALGPGYYILSAGNKVFADDFSLIGGISANLNNFDLVEFAKQQGIKYSLESVGKFKVRNHPFTELTNENKAWVQKLLDDRISHVKKQLLTIRGNKIPRDKESEDQALSGEVFTIDKALKLGLVDSIKSLGDIISKDYYDCQVKDLHLKRTRNERLGALIQGKLENVAEEINTSMICNRLSGKILS